MGKLKNQSIDVNDLMQEGGKYTIITQVKSQLEAQDTQNISNFNTDNPLAEKIICRLTSLGIKGYCINNYFTFESDKLAGYRYNFNNFKLEYQANADKPSEIVSEIIIYNGCIIDCDGLYHHNISFIQDENFIECLIPSDTDNYQLLKKLNAKGLTPHYDTKLRKYCRDFILRCANLVNIKLKGKKEYNSGFVDECTYFYPNSSGHSVFIGKNKNCFYYLENKKSYARQIKGTLDNWKTNIASYCIGNPMYEFSLMVAFSGLILKDLNVKLSSGFHIYSYEGGTGKTSVCKIASTVMANIDYLVHQWNQTTNNLELICARSNNGFLVLDELKQLRKGFSLSDIIMKVGNGKGAGRMAQDTQSSREPLEWLMYYLSTGNKLTEQLIQEREGNDLLGAEETRLYNIEMIKADNYHGKCNHAEFIIYLYQNLDKYCGIAGYEFLNIYLTPDNYENIKKILLDTFDSVTKKLKELICDNINDFWGEVHDRIITSFSVVATAGKMAKRFSILPSEIDPINTVWVILSNYLKNRGGNIDQKMYLTKLYQFVVTDRKHYFKYGVGNNYDNQPNKYYGEITKCDNQEFAEIITTCFATIYGFKNIKYTATIRKYLTDKNVIVKEHYQKNNRNRYIKIDIDVLSNLVT